MRNSRGEWSYREPNSSDNYKFVRNSGAKDWQFDDKKYVRQEIKWFFIAMASTIAFSCALGFILGWLTGGV